MLHVTDRWYVIQLLVRPTSDPASVIVVHGEPLVLHINDLTNLMEISVRLLMEPIRHSTLVMPKPRSC